MSRINYTDEATVPCSEIHRVPERAPFLLRASGIVQWP